jgi:CBS-domain-containing membrane protein
MILISDKQKTNKLHGLSPIANYTVRRLLAKLVPAFADTGCHVVSVTEPQGRILGFLDPSRHFFFPEDFSENLVAQEI